MKRLITVILALQLLLIPSLHNARAEAEYPPLPFPAELVQAVFENYTPDEEKGLISVLYSGATQDDLLFYLQLCASLGTYPCPMEGEEDELYYLIAPGNSVQALVSYLEKARALTVLFSGNVPIVTDDGLQDLFAFFSTDIRLPSNATGNVFPQFYACCGGQKPQEDGLYTADTVFDGKECWYEKYTSITPDLLENYCRHMMLFGFSVNTDYYTCDDQDAVNSCILHLSNGDAEVIVMYGAFTQTAMVFYKPGVEYTLLGVSELMSALSD